MTFTGLIWPSVSHDDFVKNIAKKKSTLLLKTFKRTPLTNVPLCRDRNLANVRA